MKASLSSTHQVLSGSDQNEYPYSRPSNWKSGSMYQYQYVSVSVSVSVYFSSAAHLKAMWACCNSTLGTNRFEELKAPGLLPSLHEHLPSVHTEKCLTVSNNWDILSGTRLMTHTHTRTHTCTHVDMHIYTPGAIDE